MTKPAERSAARLAAVQALYQMDVSGKGVTDALAEFEAFSIGREVEGIAVRPSDTSSSGTSSRRSSTTSAPSTWRSTRHWRRAGPSRVSRPSCAPSCAPVAMS